MEIFLSVAGILISVLIAALERKKAAAAEKALEHFKTHLPETILSGVGEMLSRNGILPVSMGEPDRGGSINTRYADVDGDGSDELLVEALSGPHSTTLLIFKLDLWELKKIAELTSTTICGFDVVPSEGGRPLLIESVEVAQRPGLPYVFGLRDRVTYQFIDGAFKEVGRVEGWDESDLQAALKGAQG